MLPRELFLSHSSQDHEVASKLVAVLREHGIATYFAPTNLIGAQQWQDEILAALQRCDWFAVLLSDAAIQSMWVRRETAWALKDPRFEGKIVPIILQDIDRRSLGWLDIFRYVDFRNDSSEGMRQLLRVWGIGWKGNC